MIITDEDALICDMAETYGVFDLYALPAELAATLAVGLRENSRIRTILNGMKMPLDEYLLAAIFDRVNWLQWSHTKDSEHGYPPQSILATLLEKKEEKKEDYVVFDTSEDFEAARRRIIGGIDNG